jgi:hypothetical protein
MHSDAASSTFGARVRQRPRRIGDLRIDDLSPRAFAKQDEPVYSGAAASRALPQNLQ